MPTAPLSHQALAPMRPATHGQLALARRAFAVAAALLLSGCDSGDDKASAFDHVCRVDESADNGGGYLQMSWDQDETSRFSQFWWNTSTAGGHFYSNECTQLDTSLPPACPFDFDSTCYSPGDSVGYPCTATAVAVVKGGHLMLEFETGGFDDVGKCQ